jgi:curved DNA-binding protein
MEYKDYYKILELEKNASAEEIKKTYRKLARAYHPDVNPGDKAAEEKFKEINEAYEVLADPEKRAKYDRLGASWQAYQQSGHPSGGFDWSQWVAGFEASGGAVNFEDLFGAGQAGHFSEFFEALFGMGRRQPHASATAPQAGEDLLQSVEISLEEAFHGANRIFQIGNRRIEVKIPKGATTGSKVRVRSEGKPGVGGGPKGDLYLEIKVKPQPGFERVGNDLHADLPVDLYTAILGGEATVPTFGGKIKLKIPPETQSGRTFRLKGQGMPHLKQPDQRGDLYAKVLIQLPQNLTPEEIELFEELADMRGL